LPTRNYTRSLSRMRITRPALFGGVKSPSLDLYFYLYAFLRLLTRLGGRPGWLDSYESFSQHDRLRERKFRIRYMGYSLEFTLGETSLGLNVFSPAYERTEKGLVEILRPNAPRPRLRQDRKPSLLQIRDKRADQPPIR